MFESSTVPSWGERKSTILLMAESRDSPSISKLKYSLNVFPTPLFEKLESREPNLTPAFFPAIIDLVILFAPPPALT